MRLSGLPDLQTGWKPVARARRVKRRPGKRAQSGVISRRRCCASVRATGLADELETRSPGKAR